MRNTGKYTLVASVCLAACGSTYAADAAVAANAAPPSQDAAPQAGLAQPGVANSQGAEVGEVLVTARKRSESLQNVPVSITAIGQETLLRSGATSLQDIARQTPNLTYYQGRGGNLSAPIIRGLAPQSTSTFDNNVGVFVDGVYLSAKSNLDISLFNLDRVEIVRGPQSALYGNNTFSGAINYVTQRPTKDFTGEVRTTAGTDNRFDVFGTVSGPIIQDVLTARISASYSTFDGTVKNLFGGQNLGGWDKHGLSFDTVFTPTDKFTAHLFYYYGDSTDNGSPGIILRNNCGGPNKPATVGRDGGTLRYYCGTEPEVNAIAIDPASFDKTKTQLAYLNLSYNFGRVTLRSLTSVGDYRATGLADQLTNTSTPTAQRNFTVPFNGPVYDHSEEVRLESYGNKIFDWATGIYYYKRDATQIAISGIGPNLTQASLNNVNEQFTEDVAGFALGQLNITDKLRLNGEVRYTSDANNAIITNEITHVSRTPQKTFKYATYRTSLDYKVDSNLLAYVSVASGEKSGGFNNTPVLAEQAFGPEENTTYEGGVKSQLFDHRLAIQAAVFYIDWNAVQLSTPSAAAANVNYVANFGAATAKGVELEFQAKPMTHWAINGGFSYTDPTWNNGTVDYTSLTYCPTAAICGLTSAGIGNKGFDVSGKLLPRVSRYQAQLASTYTWALSGFDVYLRGDATFRSEQIATAPIDLQYIPAQTLVNARLGVLYKHVDLSVWVDNLTDRYYPQSGVVEPLFGPSSSYSTSFIGNGRTAGVTLDYRF